MAAVAAWAAQAIASVITPLVAGSAVEGSAYLASYIAVEAAALTVTSAAVTVAELYALNQVSNLLNPPPKLNTGGSPVDWKADPQAPVPYVVGRTGTAGNIVYADVAGDKNKYLTYATVLSLGPVKAIGGFKANDVLLQFTTDSGEGAGVGQQTTTLSANASAGATTIPVANTVGFLKGQTITVGGESATIAGVYPSANLIQLTGSLASSHSSGASVLGPSTTSFYRNRMWWKSSLGARPQSSYLHWTATGTKDTPADHSGLPSTWASTAKLSGLAHTLWTLEYGSETYTTGTPKPIQTVEGVYCYDPRQDSTYPGGSGSCRSNDETTWVWSENPYIHALTWLIGRAANGVRTMGVHAPISCIDVAAFAAGANVADANGWKIGGVIYSTDGKWDVLKAMLISGAGVPVKRGATISCVVSTPQTSLDTLTASDAVGEVSIPATASRRTRINAVWPRYREESQSWQIVPTLNPVVVSAYVTADGEQRTREVEYSLVQDPTQAACLARYDIENAREIGPMVIPCKPRWMGYRPGDCITINEPEWGLSNQKVVILNRSVDPATMIATLTVRSETDGKHAYALGQTGSPPPAPSLTAVDPGVCVAPSSSDWSATGGALSSSTGALPCITVSGSCPNPNVESVLFAFRPNSIGSTASFFNEVAIDSTGATITQPIAGLAPDTSYIPIVQYRSVRGALSAPTELSAVTTGDAVSTDTTFVYGAPSSDYDYLSQQMLLLSNTITKRNQIVDSRTFLNGVPVSAALATAQATFNAAIANVNQGLVTETANRIAADSAESAARTTLATQVQANTAAIVTEQNARSAADGAFAFTLSLLGAANGAGTAFVLDTSKTQIGGGESLATRFSSISSTLGANSASISTNAAAITTLQGRTAAYLTTAVSAGGARATFRLAADGFTGSQIALAADVITIGGADVMSVSGGVVRIANAVIGGAQIDDLTVSSSKIANNAVTASTDMVWTGTVTITAADSKVKDITGSAVSVNTSGAVRVRARGKVTLTTNQTSSNLVTIWLMKDGSQVNVVTKYFAGFSGNPTQDFDYFIADPNPTATGTTPTYSLRVSYSNETGGGFTMTVSAVDGEIIVFKK